MEEQENRLNTQGAIASAVAITLENMAFEQAIPEDEPEVPVGADPYWAKLNLLSPHEGFVMILVGNEGAKLIAEAIHGPGDDLFADEPEELPREMVFDTLAELINTIAGRFLNSYLPPDQRFELGLPETGHGNVPSVPGNAKSWDFMVQEEVLKVTISGDYFIQG